MDLLELHCKNIDDAIAVLGQVFLEHVRGAESVTGNGFTGDIPDGRYVIRVTDARYDPAKKCQSVFARGFLDGDHSGKARFAFACCLRIAV